MSNYHKPRKPSAAALEIIRDRFVLDQDGVLIAAKDHGGSSGTLVLAGQIAGSVDKTSGYRRVEVTDSDGKRWRMRAHHISWFLATGAWPSQSLDHLNGNKLDNRPENLREVSHAENHRARKAARSDNTSGYRGVSFSTAAGKFSAQIAVDGKWHKLGLFTSRHAAALAYNLACEPLGFAEEALNIITAEFIEEAIDGVYERAADLVAYPNRCKNKDVRAVFTQFLPLAQSGTVYALRAAFGATETAATLRLVHSA